MSQPKRRSRSKSSRGLLRLCIGRVWIGIDERRRQCAEAAFDIGRERRRLHARDIDQRARFLRVEADENRHVVVRAGNECVVGRGGQHVGLDHRMTHACRPYRSSRSAAGRLRSAAIESARSEAHVLPCRRVRRSRAGTAERSAAVRTTPPLWPMARWNRPFARGEAISMLTAIAPADCPAIGHAPAIAAEGRDVALDPFERRDLIQQAVVARRRLCRTRRVSSGCARKPKRTEAIGDGHDDDAALRELVAPVERHRRRAVRIAAAVDPDHDGQAFSGCPRRRPDVQVEAVLARRGRRLARHRDAVLHARGCERVRLARALPRRDRPRLAPTQLADGGAAKGTPLYREMPFCVVPARVPDSVTTVPAQALAAIRHSAVAAVARLQTVDIRILLGSTRGV